jgi:3-hydroxyisobutyrate dehydrogenase-like beta-hydroxyacid dehydrogenase
MTDQPVIAVIAAGDMGAAVGARLVEHGCRVLTSLAGRSAASRARAEAAGMADGSDAALAAAHMILSIVPPGDALALAERLAPALAAAAVKPLYVDCNAISPQTALRVAAAVEEAGAPSSTPGSSAGRRSPAIRRPSTPPAPTPSASPRSRRAAWTSG